MNRVKLLTFMVLLGLIPQYALAEKLPLSYRENQLTKRRQHPAEQYLSAIKKDSQIKSTNRFNDATYNKLLIILIGFQEEIIDDPNTTGNGQFQLEAPDNYPINLSKPPHNQEYFDKMAEAMKYYYLAASLGGFELEWDIYPKDRPCYTLSQPMGYYNPPGASNEEFVSKMEEYFKESFETADQESPEIVFSDYSHYMIIHAGSDWQHDVLGDTPSDIPSFFIRVGDGKEALVDDGTYTIDYACNIPETITQDIREYNYDGSVQVSGYGALNGVMFHEFGHSLGLVDLYAVNSFYPMVGSFDIMDSGGSTEVGMEGDDGKIYSIEGIIPALPGAYSRVLMFEENFRQRGILKDIENLSQLQDIRITCAEERHDFTKAPYIYKLQLSQNEYILIENRNVDPDGDGGTAVFTGLDGRVALYPTPYQDNENTPSLEYDYLLPSFLSNQYEAVGGGLLVWKVNDDILYNQGFYDSQGNFISNFANNYVNTDYDHRGVEIIEADAIPDIGNVYAYHWRGTAFEYYFKHMPIFNNVSGFNFFTGWSDTIHNDKLNSTSTPPLMTSLGAPYSSGLYNISGPGLVMTFSYGSPVYNRTTSITSEREIITVSPIFEGTTKLSDIAVIHQDDIELFYFDRTENDFDSFITINLDQSISNSEDLFPVQKVDFNNDTNDELVLFHDTKMLVIKNNISYTFELNYKPKSLPQFYNNKYYVPVQGKVLEVNFLSHNNTVEITDIFDDVNHIATSDTDLYFFTDDAIINHFGNFNVPLPGEVILKPVILNQFDKPLESKDNKIKQYLIFKTSDHKLYSLEQNQLDLIYDYSQSIYQLSGIGTQICLDIDEEGPYIIFAEGNKVYANYLDGTFPLNFPRTFHNHNFTDNKEIMIIDNTFLNILNSDYYGKSIYLPIENDNFLAWNQNQDLIDNSLNIIGSSNQTLLSFTEGAEADSTGYYFQIESFDNSVILQWKERKYMDNPILWETSSHNPNRNLNFLTNVDNPQGNINKISAFVFPSPVSTQTATVRIFNLDNQAQFKIFDISGKLIKHIAIETNDLSHVDTVLDFSKFSSGVYIGVVEENTTYKFKFSVSK